MCYLDAEVVALGQVGLDEAVGGTDHLRVHLRVLGIERQQPIAVRLEKKQTNADKTNKQIGQKRRTRPQALEA
jgi:hypothetical protein